MAVDPHVGPPVAQTSQVTVMDSDWRALTWGAWVHSSGKRSSAPGCVHEYWPTCADEFWPTLRGFAEPRRGPGSSCWRRLCMPSCSAALALGGCAAEPIGVGTGCDDVRLVGQPID